MVAAYKFIQKFFFWILRKKKKKKKKDKNQTMRIQNLMN